MLHNDTAIVRASGPDGVAIISLQQLLREVAFLLWGRTVRCVHAVPALPCWYTRDFFFFKYDACHGSQGPEFCTPCCFELIMHASVGGWFSGVFPG